MKKLLLAAVLLVAASAQAQNQQGPLTGQEYAVNALAQKERIIMKLLDQIAQLTIELQKYKANSWLP